MFVGCSNVWLIKFSCCNIIQWCGVRERKVKLGACLLIPASISPLAESIAIQITSPYRHSFSLCNMHLIFSQRLSQARMLLGREYKPCCLLSKWLTVYTRLAFFTAHTRSHQACSTDDLKARVFHFHRVYPCKNRVKYSFPPQSTSGACFFSFCLLLIHIYI